MKPQTKKIIPVLTQNPFTPTVVTDKDDFTSEEKMILAREEEIIEKGLGTFLVVAEALATIFNCNLYRPYKTFSEYCLVRWEFGPSYAQRLLDAARVVENLPMGKNDIRPTSERQIRALTLLSEPKDMRAAWEQALKVAGEKPVTGRIVSTTVKTLIKAGAKRKTTERKATKKKPAKVQMSTSDLRAIQKHLDEIRQLAGKTPNSAKVLDVIAQIESLLP